MQLRTDQFAFVLLAEKHNPSILTKDFLAQHGLSQGEVKEFAHTPIFSRVAYEGGIDIFVDEDRLQVAARGEGAERQIDRVTSLAVRYSDLLPHVPYTAAGLNYHGVLTLGGDVDVREALRAAFLVEGALDTDPFGAEGAVPLPRLLFRHGDAPCTVTLDWNPGLPPGTLRISLNYHVGGEGLDVVHRAAEAGHPGYSLFADIAEGFAGWEVHR